MAAAALDGGTRVALRPWTVARDVQLPLTLSPSAAAEGRPSARTLHLRARPNVLAPFHDLCERSIAPTDRLSYG